MDVWMVFFFYSLEKMHIVFDLNKANVEEDCYLSRKEFPLQKKILEKNFLEKEYMFRAVGKRLFRNGKTRRRTFFSERELSFSEIGQLSSRAKRG